MDTEQAVASHYTQGDFEARLLAMLAATGKDAAHLTADDLTPIEEFHIGGREATVALAGQMQLRPGMHLLDIGSGIGGPARYFARAQGCTVTGIDLTDEFVAIASSLSTRVGLADRVTFRQGSALAMPFGPGSFDGAYMLHVGMNIPDKSGLFAEVHRVLKPGALFAVYDILRLAGGDLVFPLPWSSGPETSFVAPATTYRDGLAAAGFTILAEHARGQFAIEFFRAMRARAAEAGSSRPNLQSVMGADAALKSANLFAALERGLVAPVEMIARAD
ncbi:MAG: methyltransferase domain-containing protein [Alphaproteobacteria bacterium]|nr:methyltransferase domain-containing protein [Alphaproteobacteria bacterium]